MRKKMLGVMTIIVFMLTACAGMEIPIDPSYPVEEALRILLIEEHQEELLIAALELFLTGGLGKEKLAARCMGCHVLNEAKPQLESWGSDTGIMDNVSPTYHDDGIRDNVSPIYGDAGICDEMGLVHAWEDITPISTPNRKMSKLWYDEETIDKENMGV